MFGFKRYGLLKGFNFSEGSTMAFLAGLTSSALYLGLRNVQNLLQLMVLGVSAFIVDPLATKGVATHCGVDVQSVLSAET